MDKKLIGKIIGKKNYVDLNDEIYILRSLTYKMRDNIIFKSEFSEDLLIDINTKIKKSKDVIENIINGLERDEFTLGYTNSKIYLLKYLKDINFNLNGILNLTNELNYESSIKHTNSLIDLLLLF